MKRIKIALTALAPIMLLAGCGSSEPSADSDAQASGNVAAQADSAGIITGTVGGKPVNLSIVASQSDYTNGSFSLYSRGDALKERGFSTLRVSAEWIGSMDGGFTSTDATIDIPDTNPARVYKADKDTGLELTVTQSSESGDTMQLTGTVKGTLTKMDLAGGRNPDPNDTMVIDLIFEGSLSKL